MTDDSKEYVIDKGYNPDYGARPLRRAIENMIEDPLAEEILRGNFKGFDTITVKIEEVDGLKKLRFEPGNKSGEALAVAGADKAGDK